MVATSLFRKKIRFKRIERKKVDARKLAAAAVAVGIHEMLQEYAAAAAAAIEFHKLLEEITLPEVAAPEIVTQPWIISWRLEASAHLHRRGRVGPW
ncbi:MAG: hypothetical protein J7J11_00780 [Desulfurococcales archaeon]|nr:hypothetical protein [Desulfurococcales archaeon]